MSSITYLRLDADYDPVFDNTATLTDLDAVRQVIQTRLLLFEGEWWENLNDGTPMFQTILGKRATPQGLQIMGMALTARVAGAPYVASVQNISPVFDPVARGFSYNANAITTFGVVPVVFAPGAVAGLEG